jgi:hypothetical protein
VSTGNIGRGGADTVEAHMARGSFFVVAADGSICITSWAFLLLQTSDWHRHNLNPHP